MTNYGVYLQSSYSRSEKNLPQHDVTINRGFAAYEARQACVVGNHKLKRGYFLPLMPRWHFLFFSEKRKQKRFGLILCNLTHNPNSQNTANTGFGFAKGKTNKINAFATHRLSIAVFLPVAGYSPVRTINVSVGG